MKRYITSFLIFLAIIIISGCGRKSLTDYVNVNFTGLNTRGKATYIVDNDKLYKDLLNFDSSNDFPNEKTLAKIAAIDKSYNIEIDKDDELKNNDVIKVKIVVDKDSKIKVKGGIKEVKVVGLEEPKKLTSKDVEKKLIVNFNGVSGRGEVKVDNLLNDPLNSIDFKIENNGELKNGDKAKVLIDEETKTKLLNYGYVVDKEFKVSFDVKDLKNIAKNASNIVNLEDIKRMINEEVNIEKKNGTFSTYEINNITFMYRQFNNGNDNKNSNFFSFENRTDHGNLIGVYLIKEDIKWINPSREYVYILGYSDIFLNDNNEANIAEIIKFTEQKDTSYSIESVLKLYEGYGYNKID